jgi:hypothetical protein
MTFVIANGWRASLKIICEREGTTLKEIKIKKFAKGNKASSRKSRASMSCPRVSEIRNTESTAWIFP